MDLSFLIPGKIRRQVLQYFVENPDVQVHIRGLARELGASPQQIYQELLNMEGWGLLFSSSQGNQRVFRVNKKFPLLPPIEDLFRSLKEENSRSYDIVQTFDLKERAKQLKKIPVPPELIPGLKSKRMRPRAYAEEKMLRKLSQK